ncbi:DNA/RNA nuclease SfsA [Thermotalea metallivorans]|uniref:Sugar fermentation stimulation protein homolog n=1 Tax=Thermotalea metallivorans TaxID=520762 RepID=A0A140L886_9FIRM|nr:DNA/RNA nuclease SfsA [Thermotalea metallivorans]KXG76761.1 Sugar fermentation stimulation protein A [Thermotalea metallivorans]
MRVTINGELLEAVFIKRLNRFLAEIEVQGNLHKAHVPNTGRMKELLVEGARVIVRCISDGNRKTKYDLIMVYKGQDLVAIDAKLPNVLLEKALKENGIHPLEGFSHVQREVRFGKSRFDLALSNGSNLAFVEAKCVTYVGEDQAASFPDAPTERGRKHVLELIDVVKENMRGAVVFIVQREDALYFTPNRNIDPKFADAVTEAAKAGVEFYAFLCKVAPREIKLWKPIPVIL